MPKITTHVYLVFCCGIELIISTMNSILRTDVLNCRHVSSMTYQKLNLGNDIVPSNPLAGTLIAALLFRQQMNFCYLAQIHLD